MLETSMQHFYPLRLRKHPYATPRADLAQQPSNHVNTNGYAISVRNGIKSSTKVRLTW